jgi:hypothetical protein
MFTQYKAKCNTKVTINQKHIYTSILDAKVNVFCTVHSESHCALTKGVGSDVHECIYFVWEELQLFSDCFMCCCKPNIFLLRNYFDGLCSIESEMSINLLLLSSDAIPLRSPSNTVPVSWNFSISLRTALWWGTSVCRNFSANCSGTKSVYLLSSRKTYSTRKTQSSIERTTASKNWIKQLHTLPVLRFLTTVYSETTAHFNGNFDTDNQTYVP